MPKESPEERLKSLSLIKARPSDESLLAALGDEAKSVIVIGEGENAKLFVTKRASRAVLSRYIEQSQKKNRLDAMLDLVIAVLEFPPTPDARAHFELMPGHVSTVGAAVLEHCGMLDEADTGKR